MVWKGRPGKKMVQDMEAQFNIVSVGMNDEDKGMFGISWKNCGKSQAWTK
jgi:hypothetical protein